MPAKGNYFPFGFQYPKGLPHNDSNPDPVIEGMRERMAFLNRLYQRSDLPGHIFAAALALFQSESQLEPGAFWTSIQSELTDNEIVQIAEALAPSVANEPPRLDFPNSIALFDCRFVATKEWERIRRYSIGGSEASAVLKLSHFQSQLTLFYEKTNPPADERDISGQQILDYGHCVEDYVIESIAGKLGAVRWPEHRMFAHREYPFLTCNPDGILYFPADGHFCLFEAKTCFWKKRPDWKDGIPEYYAPQPRHYLEVLNDPKLTDGYIGVCAGGLSRDLIYHHYSRDPIAGAAQVQQLVDFWQTHIVTGIPPKFSGDAKLDMNGLYMYTPRPESPAITEERLPSSTEALFDRFFELDELKKTLSRELRDLKAREGIAFQRITTPLPDGLTLSTKAEGITYAIHIKDAKRSTVTANLLRDTHPDAHEVLLDMAAKLKEKGLPFAKPRVSSRRLTAKAIKALTST